MVMKLLEKDNLPLYESVASRLTQMIEQHTFKTGDRLPSVRRLSEQMSVSITTVMEAYRVLENRGVVEARPQSGFYVLPTLNNGLPEPDTTAPESEPTVVNVGEISRRLLLDTAKPELLQLGVAIPNPALLPVEKLNKAMVTAIRNHPVAATSYDIPPGLDQLRVQTARRAMHAGCTLSPDDIIATVGASEAIHLALRATCNPGDTIAIETPIYYGILRAIEQLNLRVLEIPTHPRDGISLEALSYALEHNTIHACMVVSNFNNPLGSCIPNDRKRQLVAMLAERNIPLLEDDIYGEIHFGTERPKVCKAYDSDGNVLLCSSFTKTLAPGYRVGWIAPGRYKNKVERLKLASTLATPSITQMAVAEFLANGGYDHHLRRIRQVYARQTISVSHAISQYFPQDTRVTRPAGGTVLWVELPEYVDSIKLYEQALLAGMTIAPGPVFSANRKYKNFIRLSVSFWSDEVDRALQRLAQLVIKMR